MNNNFTVYYKKAYKEYYIYDGKLHSISDNYPSKKSSVFHIFSTKENSSLLSDISLIPTALEEFHLQMIVWNNEI